MDLGAVFTAEASRPLVVCDIDNVLAWHAEAVCIAVNARFGTSLTVPRLTVYPFANLLEPGQARWLAGFTSRDAWCANMAPDRDAIAAIAAIRGSGHKVTVSSDRPAVVADATAAWLDASAIPRDSTVLEGPGSKRKALAACGPANPGVLIDDDPAKWLTIARPDVQVWTPARPWTPQGWQRYPNVRVFTAWAEVLGWLGMSRNVTAAQ